MYGTNQLPQASDGYAAHWVVEGFYECERNAVPLGVTGTVAQNKPNTQPEETE